MSSPRMSSRNHSLNFVLLPSLLQLLLFEEVGFYPHRGGNGFPMHA